MRVIPASCQPDPKLSLWRAAWSLLCKWAHCDIICFKYSLPEVGLSNFLTLTMDKKKLLPPLQSRDIIKTSEFCIGNLNLFSCDPLQIAITWILLWLQWSSVKLLIWIIMDSKSRCLWLLRIFGEHYFHATYSNIPVAEVSCVCSYKTWCPLATVNVDLNHPTIC